MLANAEKAGMYVQQLQALHGYSIVYEFQGDYADVVLTAGKAENCYEIPGWTIQRNWPNSCSKSPRLLLPQEEYPESRQGGSQGFWKWR